MNTENTNLEVVKKDITTQVLVKVNTFSQTGELKLPKDYSPENALRSAMLILEETKNREGKPVLDICSKASIANALLKMVVWGLSPMKKQCYFIPYGDKLECSPDYTGDIAMAKRYAGMKDIKAHAIHKGDLFEFEIDTNTGRKKVIKHQQTLESIGNKEILGAYAIYETKDGNFDTEIMNISQIKASWEQGPMKGASPAHKNFPDRMARKTVISRACDGLIRSSDDAVLYQDQDEKEATPTAVEELKAEKEKYANAKEISFEELEKPEENVKEIQTVEETVVEEETSAKTSSPGF